MKTINAVLITMILASLLSLMGCTDRDKKAIEKIEQYLQEKYGEEFVVDAIGGGYGTLTNNTLKAEVYAKSNPDELFDVAITKDRKIVWDKYMNVIMMDKINDYASAVCNSVFNEEIIVKSSVGQRGLSFPDAALNDKQMSFKDYIHRNTELDMVTDIFINSDSDIDADAGAVTLVQIAEQYQAYGIISAIIDVYYVNTSDYRVIMEEYDPNEHPIDYFERKKTGYKLMYVDFDSYTKIQSVDEIVKKIKTKAVIS